MDAGGYFFAPIPQTSGPHPQRPSRPEPASAPVDLTLQLELEGELDAVWRENHAQDRLRCVMKTVHLPHEFRPGAPGGALRGFKFETEKQLVVVLRGPGSFF